MATPLDRIKILEPRHPNRSTGIINGQTSGILNWNDIPYPSFYRAYKELSTNFWIPDEVDMKGDARGYGELSAREKNAYDSIIGLLATLDSPHTRFIYNVAEYITYPAAHANAAIIGQRGRPPSGATCRTARAHCGLDRDRAGAGLQLRRTASGGAAHGSQPAVAGRAAGRPGADYMPRIAEAAFAMLACARIGAIHCVVFGGFASGSLASRIEDASPRVIVSADAGSRGGKVVEYKPLLDEAIRLSAHKPESVLLVDRGLAPMALQAGRDCLWADLRSRHLDAQVPCTWVDASHPSYRLAASAASFATDRSRVRSRTSSSRWSR